jgi:hypothetical protein
MEYKYLQGREGEAQEHRWLLPVSFASPSMAVLTAGNAIRDVTLTGRETKANQPKGCICESGVYKCGYRHHRQVGLALEE